MSKLRAITSIFGRIFRGGSKASTTRSFGSRLKGLFSKQSNKFKGKMSTLMNSKGVSRARSAYGTTVAKIKNSRYAKAYDKLPPWLKETIGTTATFIGVDFVLSYIMGDGDGESGSEGGVTLEDAARTVALLNGHIRLVSIESEDSIVGVFRTSGWLALHDVVGRLFNDRSLSNTGTPLSVSERELDSLSDKERILIIAKLSAISKVVAHSSEHPNLIDLFSKQCAASDMINAAPTEGLLYMMSMGKDVLRQADDIAIPMCDTFSGLYDQLANAAGMDMFDEQTSFWDWWDLSSDPAAVQVTLPYLVSKMATDDLIGVDLPWWKKFMVDSDGEDDESKALELINKNGNISDWYVDLMYKLARSNASADMLMVD